MVAQTRMKPYRDIRVEGSTTARSQLPGLRITGSSNLSRQVWLKIHTKYSKDLAVQVFDFKCKRV